MYYRQPRYFRDFRCLGSECKDNCCYGWNITWSKEEIDKLKNAENISPELKQLVEKSFTPDERLSKSNSYLITFDERAKCPFLTDNSLCRIQKELGAEYLSKTCLLYPRKYTAVGNIIYRYCNISCRAVAEKILNDEKIMDLVNSKADAGTKIYTNVDYSKEKNPEYKFHEELFEFFYELISDKRCDVETNIILGALAAQSLTKLVERKEYNRIPEALRLFKAQMHNRTQIKSIENIKPNYHLRFGFIGELLKGVAFSSPIYNLNDPTGTPNVVLYEMASKLLAERFKDRPFFLRNIALNLLLELAVPFTLTDKTIFENYSLFATIFACVKLNLIAIEVSGKHCTMNYEGQTFNYEGEERFAGLTAIICRKLCQNPVIQQQILGRLNEHNFTSPAYLALLVK